jgi:putative NADH-flavin reductase
MKIALIGGAGKVGSKILKEALDRGHEVTAIIHKSDVTVSNPKLTKKKGDLLDADGLAAILKGHDAVVCSNNPAMEKNLDASKSMLKAVKKSGVKRLIMVGGAGTMDASPGTYLIDTPIFPAEVKPYALPMRDFYRDYLKPETGVDWAFYGPAVIFEENGPRTGKFRTQAETILGGPGGGPSKISYADYAVGMLDELEKPKHHRERFTISY